MTISRRDFFRFSFGSLLLVSSPIARSAKTHSSLTSSAIQDKRLRRLSYLAYKTTTTEIHKDLTNIEGEIPLDIDGKFLKIGPGTKELFGQAFNHFFDGDAYISEFKVSQGRATLKTLFLKTSERMEEQKQKKMLYHEFGTRSPEKNNKGRKNQPNINLIPWNKSLIALSEGGHPTEVDSETYDIKSLYDFKGTLPQKVSFTAHPKFDPDTKEGFGFGIYQGLSKALKIFKMNPRTEELVELYSLSQKHVFMIHDMLMTKNHLLFVIPPAYYQIKDIVLDKLPMSQTLKFDKNEKTRILVVAKDGKEKPKEFFLPARLVFHNGNAFEENGIITLQTFMTDNKSLLDLINDWQADEVIKTESPSMYEVKIDLGKEKVFSEHCLLRSHDFPVFNDQFVGKKNQFIYCASMGNTQDPMAFDGLTKFDLSSQTSVFYPMKNSEMCGEPFYIPKGQDRLEDNGYLAYIGFNQSLDQSFLEILDAKDMSFLARIWADCYLPLGFHGHFVKSN